MAETPHTEPEVQENHEMSFFDHLEELRWRLIKAMIGIVLGMIFCWIFIDWIMNQVLLKPVLAVNAALPPGQPPFTLQNSSRRGNCSCTCRWH